MGHFFLSVAIFILPLFSHVVKDIDLNDVTYVNGIYKYNDRNLTGHIVDFYENDQLKFRYTVVDGRLHGEAWEYYTDGKLKAERNYIFGKLFGAYTVYFPTGAKKLEMSVKENAYGFGEKVAELKIATKEGKKLKTKGEAKLVFLNESGQAHKRSEGLAIEEQFKFEIIKENKVLYSNE